MLYTIKNEHLALTVNSKGAEAWALTKTGEENGGFLWDGKPEVWPRRSPLCFPWCGKVDGGKYEAFGRMYEAPQHGFTRDMEHRCVSRREDDIVLGFDWAGDGKLFPWDFSLETHFYFAGKQAVTECTAQNKSGLFMPVQMGFHPGLRCPFTPGKTAQDYFIRFERPEAPDGGDILELSEHVFDNDSICFPGLRSAWVQLEERDTGRYIRVDTEGYPFVLLWSKPGIPGFVCIEPWSGFAGRGHDLGTRPGAVMLSPGESMTRALKLTVEA